MGYTLIVRDQITPKIITIDGEDRLNMGEPPVYPATCTRLVWQPANPDYYSKYPKQRTELWEDSAGNATWPQIKESFPTLPPLMEATVRAWGEQNTSAIASPYLPNERATWPYQREESRSWTADNSAPTPYCDALAASRNVPRELLLSKVLENVTLFEAASTAIFGRQQALIDLINYAGRLEDLLAAVNASGIIFAEVQNA